MPCTAQRTPTATQGQQRALDRLRRGLADGSITVVPGREITFRGWPQKGDWCDGCAYRTFTAEGSAELRRALARAEVTGPADLRTRLEGRQ